MQLTRDWQREIHATWRIQMLPAVGEKSDWLWSTRCAPVKARRSSTPDVLYRSRLTLGFFDFVRRAGLRFAVLSDLYGLHLDHEALPPYDVHPSSLKETDKAQLGTVVGAKARAEGFATIVFYNSSPLRSVPYFEILAHSGLTIYYTTRLPES